MFVKDDIEALHEKFKIQYPQSKAFKMSGVRDLPPVAGSIIWARQIDRQLSAYMRRVEDVLGRGWENHVEGQKLKGDGDSFRMKLNTQEIFDDWARKVQQRNLGVSGRIFAIDNHRIRSGRGNTLKLRVNFLPEIIKMFAEKEREDRRKLMLMEPKRTSSRIERKRREQEDKDRLMAEKVIWQIKITIT